MKAAFARLSLTEWDRRYRVLRRNGLKERSYGGPLGRHLRDGDLRLARLQFDDSPAALQLWNFLLTEEDRLAAARAAGRKLVGTMKDLGTIPVMVYAAPNLTAFYPDGAWWTPCIMECNQELLNIADRLGIDETFCPVRAMLGAFVNGEHFPLPDLLVCSVGATCDDFSAIAQRLPALGHPVLWWEIPHRRPPDRDEHGVTLPGGTRCPAEQIRFVKRELRRVRKALEVLAGKALTDADLRRGIAEANRVRACLAELRELTFGTALCPMPALELLVAEMLAIHFCSDRDEARHVLEDLLMEVRGRVRAGVGCLGPDPVRIFWVNPVADLRVMNLVEACGGRVCGTDYMFLHALDPIPTNVGPIEALARMALADPMVGSAGERGTRICREATRYGAEAVVVSRIPGASHCAAEGEVIRQVVDRVLGIPVLEIEVPPVTDALAPALATRIGTLVESVRGRRRRRS